MEANVASELEIKEDESNLINLFLNIIDHLKEDDCNSINNSVEYQEAINAFADVIKEVPLVNITELLKQVFNLPEIKAKIEEAYKIKLNICRRKIGYDIYRQLQKILLEGEIQAIKKK